jgi:hypothetical protein
MLWAKLWDFKSCDYTYIDMTLYYVDNIISIAIRRIELAGRNKFIVNDALQETISNALKPLVIIANDIRKELLNHFL